MEEHIMLGSEVKVKRRYYTKITKSDQKAVERQ